MCESKKKLKAKTISHKYTDCGLDNVILEGIKQYKCEKCKEVYYNFGDVEALHCEIAKILVTKKERLSGKEIRFLRKHLGLSGVCFAQLVGYEPEHLSRLENAKNPVQGVLDRLMRSLVLDNTPDRSYRLQDLFLEGKHMIDVEARLQFSYSKRNKKWKFLSEKKVS